MPKRLASFSCDHQNDSSTNMAIVLVAATMSSKLQDAGVEPLELAGRKLREQRAFLVWITHA